VAHVTTGLPAKTPMTLREHLPAVSSVGAYLKRLVLSQQSEDVNAHHHKSKKSSFLFIIINIQAAMYHQQKTPKHDRLVAGHRCLKREFRSCTFIRKVYIL